MPSSHGLLFPHISRSEGRPELRDMCGNRAWYVWEQETMRRGHGEAGPFYLSSVPLYLPTSSLCYFEKGLSKLFHPYVCYLSAIHSPDPYFTYLHSIHHIKYHHPPQLSKGSQCSKGAWLCQLLCPQMSGKGKGLEAQVLREKLRGGCIVCSETPSNCPVSSSLDPKTISLEKWWLMK